MKCKWCNSDIQANSQFCPYCGQKLYDTNTQINQNIENSTLNNANTINQMEEKTNIWLAILSWFIPLAGLIIFLTKKKIKNQKQQKQAEYVL